MGALSAQTQVDLRTQSKSVDFSGASVTKPMSAGNSLPATCAISQMYFLLTAPAGANLYACSAANQWTLQSGGITPGGDVSGTPSALTVIGLQGRPVANTAPSGGQALVWSVATQNWQPQAIASAGASGTSQLGDFALTVNNATTLTAGQNCSAAAPCNFRFGSVTYPVAAPAVVVLGGGSGTAYLYLTNNGALVAGSTLSLSCTAVCSVQSGVTAFPPGSIPLATVMYNLGLARTLTAVILVNLVPSVPFVIMTMTPFIEQINPSIEAAARMSGARMRQVFTKILFPLLVPGVLASAILVLVRTVGMFELTFLTAGPTSTTLVVSLYDAVFAAGIRANQSVDAMATIYTVSMMVLLIVALRFVNPTQLVTRVKESD